MNTSPCCFPRQYECRCHGCAYPAYLFLVREEELVGVHAIRNGAANPWEPVEDHWGFIGFLQEDLAQDVQHDGEHDERGEAGDGQEGGGRIRGEVAQWAGDVFEKSHCGGNGSAGDLGGGQGADDDIL